MAIARALSVDSRILVLDEPVSALDASVSAQILNLLKSLQRDLGLTYLLISHDLAVISFMSTEIGVLYLGEIVEIGERASIIADARHPYTLALLTAASSRRLKASAAFVRGEPPSPLDPPGGCVFHPRCPAADARCRAEKPSLRPIGANHRVACHHGETARERIIHA